MRHLNFLRTTGHRYIRTLSVALAGIALSASASLAQPDILIRDCPADVGAEPNSTACGGSFWVSSAICVRNTNDNGTVHQSPIYGQTNYVYVDLENIGNATLNNGVLHLYFAKASTGLTWRTSWVANNLPSCFGPGVTTYGDEIGAYTVSGLAAGGTLRAEIPWSTVPNPGDFCDPDAHHFCLLARFESAEDPMTFTEVPSVLDNTRNNNNIAWKNCSIVGGTTHRCPLQVRNPENSSVAMSLHFDVDASERNNPFTNHGHIQINLGTDLFQEWTAGGRQGSGIVPTNPGDPSNNSIDIIAPNAQIDNIVMKAGEERTIHVDFTLNADQNVGPFHWDLTQYEAGSHDPLGGEQYIISPTNNGGPQDKRSTLTGVLAGTFKLSAQPNPSPAATTLTYSLPVESTVSISIFDANGRPVRELLSNADRAAGEYQIMWDGASAGGKRVPSGTYICRLSTAAGSMERQIKITR